MPKVSILMNCYNCQKYLKEAVDSIYAQDYDDWELIFVDNCSDDGSAEILDGYDDRINYFRTEKNIELGAARNFGLQKCRGEYLAFLDTDDIWLPGKLKRQTEMLDSNRDMALCYGGVIFIDAEGREGGRLVPAAGSGNVFPYLLKRYEINMQTVLMRRNADLEFDESMQFSPDYDLFMRVASRREIGVVKGFLVKYRKLGDSLTGKKMERWWLEMKKTLDGIFEDQPALKERYARERMLAYAKTAYYRARYQMRTGDYAGARRSMSGYRSADMKYAALYALSFIPPLWNFVHRFR